MIEKLPIRLAIIVYVLVFCGGLALLVTTFLSWRLGDLTADLHQRDIQNAVGAAEDYIKQEIQYRMRALEDYASFPAITQGVLNPTAKQTDIAGFLGVLSAEEKSGDFTLLDFRGRLIQSTQIGWQPSADFARRSQPLLDDQQQRDVLLLMRDEEIEDEGKQGMCELVVPVAGTTPISGEPSEGLLVHAFRIQPILDNLPFLRGDEVAMCVNSLSGTTVWTSPNWDPEKTIDQVDRVGELDLEIGFQIDGTIVGRLRSRVVLESLALIIFPVLLALGLGIWFAQRFFGRPIHQLKGAALQLAEGSLDEARLDRNGFQELNELTRTFEDMRSEIIRRDRQLIRSNKELERFAYVAAHDMREPLRTISNLLGLLEEETGESLSEDVLTYLTMARNRASGMQDMLNDLLTMSRLHTQLKTTNVELDEVVQKVTDALRHRIDERNLLLEVDPLPTVQGTESLLIVLFQNLIDNAMKFMPPNTRPHVRIGWTRSGPLARITVADNGIGFKPEYGEKIFDAFVRLHGKQEYSGSGIGLAMCQRIVELHQGTIQADSTPGKGTTFTIEIPQGEGIL